MKRNFIAVVSLVLCVNLVTSQGVGIGTTTPSANAALDVSSTNKGLMLPRVNDTTLVTNPSAGLLIYNRKTNTPAYHDGSKWQSVFTAMATDSITYTVSGTTGGIVAGTYRCMPFNASILTQPMALPAFYFEFTKSLDINSIAFTKISALGQVVTSPNFIEFKVFTPGTTTLTYSVKLSTWRVGDIHTKIENGKMVESIVLSANIFGYKDWVNNKSFAYNISTNTEVSY